MRRRRIGSGHLLVMGPSAAYIAVSIGALTEGGPALLATLVLLSALPLFRIARRLSRLRRVLTPTVSATIIMLIPVTLARPLTGSSWAWLRSAAGAKRP